MHERITKNKAYAKRMVRIRSSTVEPVLGTLINFRNMKRVNTRGIQGANKHVLMAAISYNLHKLMRFIVKTNKIKTMAIQVAKKMAINPIKSLILLLLFIKTTTRHYNKNTFCKIQFNK